MGALAPGGAAPLGSRRRWQVVCGATLLLLPAFWGLLAAMVSAARGSEAAGAPNAAAALALGVAVVPFVFVVLAFGSGHPRPPTAVLQAMGLAAAVGLFTSVLAPDGVTGIVAGVGAGGVVALRRDPAVGWRPRAAGVAAAAAYTFVLVRTVAELALLAAPVFPLTAVALADEWVEWRAERARRSVAAH